MSVLTHSNHINFEVR